MILSFDCDDTEKLFYGQKVSKKFIVPAQLHSKTVECLQIMHAVTSLQDFWLKPSLKLKKVINKKAYYELRINNKYRIYFKWTEQGAGKARAGKHL